MKPYVVIKSNGNNYDYVVIATSCINPISVINEVASDFRCDSSRILIDLTLVNGMKNNRYITGEIQGGKFNRVYIQKAESMPESVRDISKEFFMGNPQVVDDGAISGTMKFLLKNGII